MYKHEGGSINTPSRVPRYQNPQEVVGFCDFLVKSPNIGGDLVGVDVSLLLSSRQRK